MGFAATRPAKSAPAQSPAMVIQSGPPSVMAGSSVAPNPATLSWMIEHMPRLRWFKTSSQVMSAAVWIDEGDLIRLSVAPQPRGGWDWRVWHTVYGHNYRFGVSDTAKGAVNAAEAAAMELSLEQTGALKQVGLSAVGDPVRGGTTEAQLQPVSYNQRLLSKIFAAFHTACDSSDIEVARALLRILDQMVMHRPMPPHGRRRIMDQFIAAYSRHWHLINEMHR